MESNRHALRRIEDLIKQVEEVLATHKDETKLRVKTAGESFITTEFGQKSVFYKHLKEISPIESNKSFRDFKGLLLAIKDELEGNIESGNHHNLPSDKMMSTITRIKNRASTHNSKPKWTCFLSYSSKDKHIIKNFIDDLQRKGITYWYDEDQIKPGEDIPALIQEGLLCSRSIVPFFSTNQLNSGWCRAEYDAVMTRVISQKGKHEIIPFILDNSPIDSLPLFLQGKKCMFYQKPPDYERLLTYLAELQSR